MATKTAATPTSRFGQHIYDQIAAVPTVPAPAPLPPPPPASALSPALVDCTLKTLRTVVTFAAFVGFFAFVGSFREVRLREVLVAAGGFFVVLRPVLAGVGGEGGMASNVTWTGRARSNVATFSPAVFRVIMSRRWERGMKGEFVGDVMDAQSTEMVL